MKEIEILTSQLEYSARILNDVQQDKKKLIQEKESLNRKLDVALEALQRISEIGYYHDYGDHRAVATKALEQVKEVQ